MTYIRRHHGGQTMCSATARDTDSMNDQPEQTHIFATDEERARAERYSRLREWLVLVGILWGILTSLLSLTTGLSAALRRQAERVAPRRLGSVMPYTAAALIISALVDLPLSFYSGWMVEHRYDLSNQSRRHWFLEQLKGMGVGLVIGLPLVQGVYWVIRHRPRSWWADLSALTVPLSILMVNLAPVLLLPLFNKFEPLRDRKLAQRIRALAARQGVQVADVMQMDMSKQTKKPNAMFTGLGNTKRIVLGDTLIKDFTADEIEVVLAHELGHQVHHDIWKLIALSAPTSVVSLYSAHRFMPPILRRFGNRWGIDPHDGAADVAALPLLGLLARLAVLAIGPLLNGLVRRLVEHPADEFALATTNNPEAFVSAMENLGRLSMANPHPSRLVKYLLYDHPPIGERIAYGRSWRKQSGR